MNEQEIEVRVNQELQRIFSDPRRAVKIYAQALQQSEAELSTLKQKISSELVPKAEHYDLVMGTDNLIDMAVVAKNLNFKGMGRNKLFEYLRGKGVLNGWNKPYQAYVDRGYFKLVQEPYKVNGITNTYFKPVATQKGLEYIGKLLKGEGYVENDR